jgi:rhodanese-related sulfurtransferase
MTREELTKTAKDDFLLIDIREDFELSYNPPLKEAIHIPMQQLLAMAEDGQLPKDKLIVTVCQSGGRCHPVNHHLQSLGYHVDLLEGGMNN